MPTATRTRRTRKPAPEPEIEELEVDETELEIDPEEDDEDEAPAPKRRGRPAAKTAAKAVPAQRKAPEAETYGTAWLTDHVNDALDTEYDSKAIRVRLRQMVEAGALARDEGRYSFTGPNDRRVAKIVKYIRDSAKADAARQAAAVEDDEDEKPARRARTASRAKATAAPAVKRGRPARKPAVVEEDPDLPDFDDDEIDDL